jgi:hypothetical protein
MNTPLKRLLSACQRLKELDAKATPGPWRITPGGFCIYKQANGGNVNIVAVTAHNNKERTRKARNNALTIAESRELCPILARLMPVMVEALMKYRDHIMQTTEYEHDNGKCAAKALAKIEEEFLP